MSGPLMTIHALDMERVLQETLETVGRAKEEIFYIAEDARQELEETRAALARIRQDTSLQIALVDELQNEDRQVRRHLLEVSRDFAHYGEDAVRDAYEHAKNVQTRLQVALERERHLRNMRDTLERRLRRLQATLQRADSLVSQVSVALQVLAGNLNQLADEVEGARARQALGVTIIKAQEEERRRLARDIHDGPAQLLANVALRVDLCQRLLDTDLPRVRAELAKLTEMVRQSLQDVRKVIFDLRPLALDDLGLAPAVRALITNLESQYGLRCRLNVQGPESRLEQALEIAGFRIVQEALTNVWKHAETDEAEVTIRFTADAVELEISDQGQGFEPDEKCPESYGGHFGLLNMRERVALLQGHFQVTSKPGSGTRLQVTLPLDPPGSSKGDEADVSD